MAEFFNKFVNSFSSMGTLEITSQAVGIIAMILIISSFQMKTPKTLLIITTIANAVWATHYFLNGMVTGSFMGFYMNIVSIVRNAFFVIRDKKIKWAQGNLWLVFFSVVFATFYILNFTVFGVPKTTRNYIIEILPVIACITGTISLGMKSAKLIRITYLTSSPFWLSYNICVMSIGGIINEILSMCSIVIGMIRLDRKKNEIKE